MVVWLDDLVTVQAYRAASVRSNPDDGLHLREVELLSKVFASVDPS